VRLLLARWRARPSGGGPMNAVEQSYEYCARGARRARISTSPSCCLTAQRKPCALSILHAHCDDLSDEPGATRAPGALAGELEEALEGRFTGIRLAGVSITRFAVRHPARLFRSMIDVWSRTWTVLRDVRPTPALLL